MACVQRAVKREARGFAFAGSCRHQELRGAGELWLLGIQGFACAGWCQWHRAGVARGAGEAGLPGRVLWLLAIQESACAGWCRRRARGGGGLRRQAAVGASACAGWCRRRARGGGGLRRQAAVGASACAEWCPHRCAAGRVAGEWPAYAGWCSDRAVAAREAGCPGPAGQASRCVADDAEGTGLAGREPRALPLRPAIDWPEPADRGAACSGQADPEPDPSAAAARCRHPVRGGRGLTGGASVNRMPPAERLNRANPPNRVCGANRAKADLRRQSRQQNLAFLSGFPCQT